MPRSRAATERRRPTGLNSGTFYRGARTRARAARGGLIETRQLRYERRCRNSIGCRHPAAAFNLVARRRRFRRPASAMSASVAAARHLIICSIDARKFADVTANPLLSRERPTRSSVHDASRWRGYNRRAAGRAISDLQPRRRRDPVARSPVFAGQPVLDDRCVRHGESSGHYGRRVSPACAADHAPAAGETTEWLPWRRRCRID
jgi:hypothetical protein